MSDWNKLFLHEEIMLLAFRDQEGTVEIGSMYKYAIGGAILAELLLGNRIKVVATKRKKFVELISSKPFGDPVIDECIKKIQDSKRRASLETWVSRFTGVKDLKNRIAIQLCRRGILRADEDKVFLIFTRKIYPEVNPEPEKKLIGRLQVAIYTDAEQIDPRTVVLLALANSADLLKMSFDKKRLKERKKRIEKIINGDLTGHATKEAIEAMQAAVMVAVITPTIVTTTLST